MTEIGPVQVLAIRFGADANFESRILDELIALEDEKTIRLLDVLFVHRDADSDELVAIEAAGPDLGAIVGALLGFEFEGEDGPPADPLDVEGTVVGLSGDELRGMAGRLEPGASAAFALIEHVWARDLKQAIRGAGGVPIGEGFLTPELVASVAPELAAMSETIDEMQKETS